MRRARKKNSAAAELRQKLKRVDRLKQIRLACDAIVEEFHPERIVLFGSHAYGHPRPDSDVDLLVVMPFDGSQFRQAALMLGQVVRAVGVLPMDLIVRTPEQVRERMQMGDGFMREITERGKVMYEADHGCRRVPLSRFSATKTDAKDALTNCLRVRKVIRGSFGLPV